MPSRLALTLLPARAALAASLLLLGSTPAWSVDDPMMSLLREHGVVVDTVRPASPAAERAPAPTRGPGAELVMAALNFLDVQYRYGGNDAREGFDCSGFTRYVFATALGLQLPRRADQQARQPGWQRVDSDELRPGDLVFFNTLKRAFSHVGLYIGDGRFVHAPRSGAQVRVEDMTTRYWQQRFNGARRADTRDLPQADAGG